jgi:hypothetical protein
MSLVKHQAISAQLLQKLLHMFMFHGVPGAAVSKLLRWDAKAPVEFRSALALPRSNPPGARGPTTSGVSRTHKKQSVHASQTYPSVGKMTTGIVVRLRMRDQR